MLWSTELSGRPSGALRHRPTGLGRTSTGSDYRDVPLVVQSPGRVPHQTHRAVALSPGRRGALLDRRSKCPGRPSWKLRERTADRVEDVRVGAAHLRATQSGVQPTRQLVEDVEAGRRVLDLDSVEV